jgi:RHH-type proline utilization regulon transcriptional repressor/proline dehydrogenase/delta 1-pyrroline-5-carboxylate dehydrogenase
MAAISVPSLETTAKHYERQLLEAAESARAERIGAKAWADRFIDRLMDDSQFRTQALRFIDVLPSLSDDRDLLRHLREYFADDDLALPTIFKWGLDLDTSWTSRPAAAAVRGLLTYLSARFLGGADNAAALTTAQKLWNSGCACSLDLVGEAVVSEADAQRYQRQYLDLIDQAATTVNAWQSASASVNGDMPKLQLSLKLSSLYSQITPLDPEGSAANIARALRPLLLRARERQLSVCLDMEQYDYKDVVLRCFKDLLMEPAFKDWPDAGIAIQAYLRDTERDLDALIEWARQRATPVNVRLVRGAYWDYETIIARQNGWPIPVWQQKQQTDECYSRCIEKLLKNHIVIKTAVATHNLTSQAQAIALAEHLGLGKDGLEFQMLYGMAPMLQASLPGLGYRLRMYLPFGKPLPAMAYLVRRLLENSSSQSFQNLFRATPPRINAHSTPTTIARIKDSVPEPPEQRFINEPMRRFIDDAERQAFAKTIARVQGETQQHYPLVIDGQPVKTGTCIDSRNPAKPEELIGTVAAAGANEADSAIAGARRALPAWLSLNVEGRAAVLQKAAALLQLRRDEFAAWEVLEAGKGWREADADVCEAIDFIRFYCDEALRLLKPRSGDVAGENNRYAYLARGVGLVIPPWNFPLAILTGMLSAALVTGNTVVLKPSSQTPVIAARFVALLHEAGLPPGVAQFLPGRGDSLGDALVTDPRIHFIAFTGSKEVGSHIHQLAAGLAPGQTHFKHLIAEMGGKNAIIVDSDADLDDAVPAIVQSAFGYQGQKCSACSRVVCVGPVYASLLERLVEATRSLKMGDPKDPGMFLGPVIDARARERILAAIEQAQHDAKLALQRDAKDAGPGYFVGPAIFYDVPPDCALAQEEIFGPVLSLLPARDFDQALALANESQYALTGGVYSRSPAHIALAEREFQVGNLYINRKITGALVGRQPFGGFKLSGLGTQAGGRDYLLQFLLPRTITENTLRHGFAPEDTA